MLLLTLASALAGDPLPATPDDAPLADDEAPAASDGDVAPPVAAPPEAEALQRALSMRHPVPCDELEAGLADPVDALRWAVANVQQPPWAAMHAAECLALGHGAEVQADLQTWVTDPELKGLGMQTIGMLPQLEESVAVEVTRAALEGTLAERATAAARDDGRPAVQAVVNP